IRRSVARRCRRWAPRHRLISNSVPSTRISEGLTMPFDQMPDDGTGAPGGQPGQPTAPTYDYDHTDENGVHVFRGNDGNLYYESLTGPNGFEYLPYSGPGVTNPAQQSPSPTPTAA